MIFASDGMPSPQEEEHVMPWRIGVEGRVGLLTCNCPFTRRNDKKPNP